MFSTDDLKKSFGKVEAVKSVSLKAEDGMITGLLGPNGAGKSTTIKMISGILKPDNGSIHIDGQELTPENRVKTTSNLGILSDVRGLYPRLTSRENISYFGKLRKMSDAAIAKNTQNLVQILEMQDIIDRPTKGFSTGQMVKVCIARALVHDPQNIILDEPSAGLDVMAIRSMREAIKHLKQQGKAIVLSSHIMQEIGHLCDRVTIIRNGRSIHDGTIKEIIDQSGKENIEDAFVALLGTTEGMH